PNLISNIVSFLVSSRSLCSLKGRSPERAALLVLFRSQLIRSFRHRVRHEAFNRRPGASANHLGSSARFSRRGGPVRLALRWLPHVAQPDTRPQQGNGTQVTKKT